MDFVSEFFKEWKQVGAISPSSTFLVNDMLDEVDFRKARIIVELGAGSGSFTKEILRRMDGDAKFFVFEINQAFYSRLSRIKDSRLKVIHDSAENILKYIPAQNVDYVISGIPLSNLKKEDKKNIIRSSLKTLKKNGLFLQFQYFPESLSLLKQFFKEVKLKFTFLNTPPAFFYICRKF